MQTLEELAIHRRTPSKSVARRELLAAVEQAIERLPEDYRAVIVLRFMEDLTYDEIARHLGVPVSTVETRLHRAKKQLRELLRELVI